MGQRVMLLHSESARCASQSLQVEGAFLRRVIKTVSIFDCHYRNIIIQVLISQPLHRMPCLVGSWSRHCPESAEVRACEGLASSKGNGLFAKRSLLEDELLFEEDPVCGMAMLMFDDASSEGFCQHCLVWLREDSGKVFCPRKCGAPYCSHSCRDAAHWAYHDVLCPAANPRWAEYVQRAQECGNEYYVLAARALASLRNCVPVPVPQGDAWQQTPWLGYAAPPWWQTMKRPVYDTDDESDSAASSSEDLDSEANASLDRFFQSAVRTQTSEMAEELSAVLSGSSAAIASLLAGPEALGRLMGLVRVNSMAVQSQCYEDSEDGLAKGMAIYPVTSAMNHDVESNCYVASNPLEPQRCYVRTRRPVAAGEELCIDYLSGAPYSMEQRREILQHQYGIPCSA